MTMTAEELYEGTGLSSGESAPEGQAVAEGGTPTEEPQANAQPPTETVSGEPGEGDPEDLTGLKNALEASRGDFKAEKKRRREAEERLADYERRLAALEQGPKPKEIGPEDIENEFFQHPGQYLQSLQEQARDTVRSEVEDFRMRYSEYHAKQRHEDYLDARQAFAQLANQKPWLWNEIDGHPDPAEVVYQFGKQILGSQDPQSQNSGRVQELEAEVQQLKDQLQSANLQPRHTIPKSNAGARGSSVGTKGAWSGPPSAEQVYGD